MLAYSELKPLFSFLINEGIVTKIYHDIIIWSEGDNRYPAYRREGDDGFVYTGIDDTTTMNCYIRQTGNVEKLKSEWIGSCKKIYICRVPYRVVFFSDFEDRNFDSLYSKILKSTLYNGIELIKLVTDFKQILNDETNPRGFHFGASTFYAALDIVMKFSEGDNICPEEINCEKLPNPLTADNLPGIEIITKKSCPMPSEKIWFAINQEEVIINITPLRKTKFGDDPIASLWIENNDGEFESWDVTFVRDNPLTFIKAWLGNSHNSGYVLIK